MTVERSCERLRHREQMQRLEGYTLSEVMEEVEASMRWATRNEMARVDSIGRADFGIGSGERF